MPIGYKGVASFNPIVYGIPWSSVYNPIPFGVIAFMDGKRSIPTGPTVPRGWEPSASFALYLATPGLALSSDAALTDAEQKIINHEK